MTHDPASAAPLVGPAPSAASPLQGGVLPSQELRAAVAQGLITANHAIDEEQIQPASLDLRCGPVAHRVRASFLPGRRRPVIDCLEQFRLYDLDLNHPEGVVLEQGAVYIIPLAERLHLPEGLSGLANPKSSTGRLDIFARLITDHGTAFDQVDAAYHGALYAEISPRAFPIRLRAGSRLVQLRLRRGLDRCDDNTLRELQHRVGLVSGGQTAEIDPIRGGVLFTVDLSGLGAAGVVGYRARKFPALVDIDHVDHYPPLDYWEPLQPLPGGGLILDPADFYILATKEAVVVPPDHAAEMLAYDTLAGEFRVHYAGFFDPGFGHPSTGGQGSRAVLEVRAHQVPFRIEDGQILGRLVYEPLTALPDKLYGTTIGSSYQCQGLALGKQFRQL